MAQEAWVKFQVLAPSRSGNTPKKGTHSLKQNSNEWPINVIMTTIQGSDAPVVYIALVWKANCIRHTKRKLPSSSYNHNTLATLICDVRGGYSRSNSQKLKMNGL